MRSEESLAKSRNSWKWGIKEWKVVNIDGVFDCRPVVFNEIGGRHRNPQISCMVELGSSEID